MYYKNLYMTTKCLIGTDLLTPELTGGLPGEFCDGPHPGFLRGAAGDSGTVPRGLDGREVESRPRGRGHRPARQWPGGGGPDEAGCQAGWRSTQLTHVQHLHLAASGGQQIFLRRILLLSLLLHPVAFMSVTRPFCFILRSIFYIMHSTILHLRAYNRRYSYGRWLSRSE